MILSAEQRQHIEQALEEIGLETDIRESYCGRHQSKPCFGIKLNHPDTAQEFFVELAILDSDLSRELVRACRHDSLGKGTITYFPGYTLSEEE